MFTLGNMGVMTCLCQGGLRSPSASSLSDVFMFFVLDLNANNFKFVCNSQDETETTDIGVPASLTATITHFYPGDGRTLTIYDTADHTEILGAVESSAFTHSADDPRYFDATITHTV